MKYILSAILLTISTQTQAHLNLESYYQNEFCTGMDTEVVMSDGTRADCVGIGIVIEVDFAEKWYQAVGQSLAYANLTGLHPVIVLIVEDDKDCKHISRLYAVLPTIMPKIVTIETGPYKNKCK